METVEDIHELIGNTPMIHLNHFSLPDGVNIYAKAELFNPGGSIKDRLGEYIIAQAEKRGSLKPGSTIIEVTAGNTGIGLAMAALHKGYHLIFVVPESYAEEKQIIMRNLGAEIVNVSAQEGMPGARKKAEEILHENTEAFFVNQFENPDNPDTYYASLGPEIYKQMDGKIDYFVCGAGSGGTFTGTSRYLKEKSPDIKTILADPVGSIIGGGQKGSFTIEGIGNHFIPGTMDLSLVDEVVKVNDNEAKAGCRWLAADEGLLCGSSSGAALAAVLKMIKNGKKGNFVIILPDRAERYFSEGLFQ